MKKLLRLKPTRGLVYDTPAHEVGAEFFTAGRNVQFRGGFAQRVSGSRQVYGTMPVTAFELLNSRMGSTNWWLVFGPDAIHAFETSNMHDITPSSGLETVAEPWEWNATLLNGVPVFNNGRDAPMYWDGNPANEAQALPDWPAGTIAKHVVAFKYHLVALDIDGPSGRFESQVLWSDAAEPGAVPASWTPAPDNEAGSTQLGDTPGPVMTAVPLRGSLLIYKRSSTYAMDYIPESNEIFSFRTLFSSLGALTRHAVADLNGEHFVVTDGDIVITDGTNRRSVAEGRMKDYLFRNLDQDHYENLFAIYHRSRNEVWVCYPETGHQFCNKALVYDVAADSFGERDLDDVACAAVGIVNDTAVSDVWDDDDEPWDFDNSTWNETNYSFATESLVTGGASLIMQDTSDNAALPSMVARHDLTFDAPERVKFVRRAHILTGPNSGTLSVRLGARMTPTAPITWSAPVSLAEPSQIVNAFAQGRYISVEISASNSSTWKVTGIELEAEMRGYH